MNNTSNSRNLEQVKNYFFIFGSLIICLLILIRYQIANGFSTLSGDRYDAVIVTTILEHWYRVFLGYAEWTNVGYYFPYEKSIGYTDGYFINGLTYAPFRMVGIDPFLSFELSGLVIKTVGFFGAYLFCRRALSYSIYWSLLVAVLFTLSNGMTVHSSRIQLATVAFFPIMGLLLYNMFIALNLGDLKKFRATGFFIGLLYGAWCLTCFYMAWFFLLYITIFLSLLILFDAKRLNIKEKVIGAKGSIFFVLLSAIISLLPFLYIYVPKSLEVGVRSYPEALHWTVPLEGVLQVGVENILWGKLYNYILLHISPEYVPNGEYYNVGFNFLIFSLFILGCIKIIRSRLTRSIGLIDSVLFLIVASTIISLLLTINFSGRSAWYFVFNWFPGAKALRVVSTFFIFLAFPVILIGVRFLANLRISKSAVLSLCILLIASELNRPALKLDRDSELNRISLPLPPPGECNAFYVSGWRNQESLGRIGELYAHNVSAMLISQFVSIPTLNGIASFNPPDADFDRPNSADYNIRVYRYAKKHDINNLCKLDLNSKTWSVVSKADIDMGYLPVPFFKESNWHGRIFDVQGLYSHEAWGTWSVGDEIVFEFNAPLPDFFELHLKARAFGPNIGKDFEVHLGGSVAKFRFDSDRDEDKVIKLFNSSRLNKLTIRVPMPTSPKLLTNGLNSDDRNLGIGFVEMKIVDTCQAPPCQNSCRLDRL